MTARKQPRSRRGLVLSDAGFARVNRARRRLELERNDGGRISLEQLSFEVSLSTKTLSRLFGREVPVDRRTIELLFTGLDLTFAEGDAALPELGPRLGTVALPRYPTMMFGRDVDIARLHELANRRMLVTLTGSGGVGKTRLAVEWAHNATYVYHAISFVDVTLLTDEATLRAAISAFLHEGSSRHEPALLVLDGCEHLIDATARMVTDILSVDDHLSVLATSREPLNIAGEVVVRVAPLEVPAADSDGTAQALQSPAFAMFVERARSFDDRFSFGDDKVDVVADIVRRLEGVPLSLELAAARSAAMTLSDLQESLRDHLDVLNAGARNGIARHRSVRSLIDWSYTLLNPQEGALFRRLAAFMGSFDRIAAAAVCFDGADARSVIDLLASLVRKSLVIVDGSGTATRYRLLETVRQYAAEKLAEEREAAEVRQRHAIFYFDLAVRASDAIGTSEHGGVVRELQGEIANLREALEWSMTASRNAYLGAALAAQLGEFWDARGDVMEGEHWLRRASDSETCFVTVDNRAKIHEGLALAAYRRGRPNECIVAGTTALELYARIDDHNGRSRVRNLLGLATVDLGDIAGARHQFEEILAVGHATNDPRAVSSALVNLGRILAEHDGLLTPAMRLFEKSLDVARENGLAALVVTALRNLAECAIEMGIGPAVTTYAQLGATEAERLGNFEAAAAFGLYRAAAGISSGGLEATRDVSLTAWRSFVRVPYRASSVTGLDIVASALAESGSVRGAALLLGATDALRRRSNCSVSSRSLARRNGADVRIRAILPAEEVDALQTRGSLLPIDEIVHEALLDPV